MIGPIRRVRSRFDVLLGDPNAERRTSNPLSSSFSAVIQLMPDVQFLTILGLGFLLGARHALDADHLAAVSTILSKRPSLQTSGFIGLCWGFGHTLMLLFVGIGVIFLKVTIPESLAQTLEFGIGIMLVVLGSSLAWSIYQEGWHFHAHEHHGERHLHLHSHQKDAQHRHSHWMHLSVRPLLIGMAHGLAGSAALMLMVLSTMQTMWQGIVYILIFGIGSIIGMVLLGLLISVPLVFSAMFGRRVQHVVQGLAGLGSVVLGLMMMIHTANFNF
jgi:cytochrome c biogenesis protein CcdA